VVVYLLWFIDDCGHVAGGVKKMLVGIMIDSRFEGQSGVSSLLPSA
jgi:hypothetical protein